MRVSFSIVLCCYNSIPRLQPTLAHLAALEYPKELVEIIVVDNASTDGTATFATHLWEEELQHPFTYRTILEEKSGLSHARHAGIKASSNTYLIFVDDDNWLDKDYLKNANLILAQHSEIGLLGGRIEGAFETPPPDWMYPFFPFRPLLGNLAISTSQHKNGRVELGDHIFGAGAIFKTDILKKILALNIPQLLEDRKGNVLSSGGDTELCHLVRMTGHQLYRAEQLKMKHYMSSGRLEWEYMKRLFHGFGYSDWILQQYEHLLKNGNLESVDADVELERTTRKANNLERMAKVLSCMGIGSKFKKNKLYLLAAFQSGRRLFLETERNRLEEIQRTIQRTKSLLKD